MFLDKILFNFYFSVLGEWIGQVVKYGEYLSLWHRTLPVDMHVIKPNAQTISKRQIQRLSDSSVWSSQEKKTWTRPLRFIFIALCFVSFIFIYIYIYTYLSFPYKHLFSTLLHALLHSLPGKESFFFPLVYPVMFLSRPPFKITCSDFFKRTLFRFLMFLRLSFSFNFYYKGG